ncbi:DJ-1/PfpI family protein [Candidatus Micrarchaeota archaeon]|nr:DJ-1/PfpI family protein [Candidatus Micrarchaeota archaeon]
MKKVLFVIAPEGFRDEELFHTKEVLEFKGAACSVASTRKGTAVGKLGAKAEVKKEISEVEVNDFDAVAFVGGPGVEKYKLYENEKVLKLAKEFSAADKITTAICIAPRILAMAGILQNKRATCFPDPGSIALLKQRGAKYEEEHVVKDGKIITADGPESARKFGEKIAHELKL